MVLAGCDGKVDRQASDDESVGVYFNYTNRLIRETLEKAKLAMEDIAWILPQNMNRKAWDILARVVKVDRERIYHGSLADVAHVISGDNVINLQRLDASGRIESGDRVMLIMAGYGMNWQTARATAMCPTPMPRRTWSAARSGWLSRWP